ncbi:hypothetical protein Ssi02_04870 [Sinosporangium siamense]|uniref:HTH araC/xylS-type domain-containing protein n=1 Tax=Sinosporangium siamense TaxID=1367973 RepID=A0A919V4Y7_9ACTN|nr:helix-turn-helix domain-containing protein [Sinosporangium siamense]GII90256.1 hypothetical protein Ssi02_04870 [Sinosporangium siamense]
MAAEPLAERDVTIASVARRVGYADAFSFSSAFKGVNGVSPSTFREAPRDEEAQARHHEALRPHPPGR